MATTFWTGAVSGDINVAGNYTNGVPANGDTFIVTDAAVRPMNTNMAALAAVNLALMEIRPGTEIDIGGSGSPLLIDSAQLIHSGNGSLWHTAQGGTNDIIIYSPNMNNAAVLAGTGSLQIWVMRGHVKIVTGNTDNIGVGYHTIPDTDARVDIDASGTLTSLTVAGGQVTCKRATTRTIMAAGTLTQKDATITNLWMTGGLCRYEHTALVVLYAVGGTTDFNTTDDAKTVTGLVQYPGGSILDSSLVTYTTAVRLAGLPPKIE